MYSLSMSNFRVLLLYMENLERCCVAIWQNQGQSHMLQQSTFLNKLVIHIYMLFSDKLLIEQHAYDRWNNPYTKTSLLTWMYVSGRCACSLVSPFSLFCATFSPLFYALGSVALKKTDSFVYWWGALPPPLSLSLSLSGRGAQAEGESVAELRC